MEIHVDKTDVSKQDIEKLAEMMTIANPPLTFDAVKAIDEQRSFCLRNLSFDEIQIANAIFDLVEQIPPLKSCLAAKLLDLLESFDFSAQKILDAPSEQPPEEEDVDDNSIDEGNWGFKHGTMGQRENKFEVWVDEHKAQRHTISILAKITDRFTELDNSDLASDIVKSCHAILEFRRHLSLAKG